jgi:hypothetical protein
MLTFTITPSLFLLVVLICTGPLAAMLLPLLFLILLQFRSVILLLILLLILGL